MVEGSWAKRGGMDDRVEIYGSESVVYANVYQSDSLLTHSESDYGFAGSSISRTQGWTFSVFKEL